ncbi:MAG: carbohydrate ABC transporter permease [Defluviitaleaceae bacterium]|nr:carbohydrate ABC transporter permease [Defluviitaleaceae bacterium]
MKRKINRSLGGTIALFLFIALVGAFMALPLIFTVNNAFKPLDEFFLFPPRFWVRNPTTNNFADLFILMAESWVPFSRYILNSIFITGAGTFGHVIIAAAAAYPLAKHEFKGKAVLFSIVVLSLMFSPQVTAIPNYMVITLLGFNNTYAALIVPAFAFSLGLYLMKQFMEQIPDSLLESAQIDGASEYRTFFSIVMPNVKPAWLTLAILMFQQLWGNTGGMFIRSEQLRPLNFALLLITQGGVPARAGASAAVGLIIMSVPITFFIISQSSIIETMTTSGMKE